MNNGSNNGAQTMDRYSNAHSKFDRSLDIKDIAKALRQDIKAMQKSGLFSGMKVSVQIERFSMGQALRVAITKWDGQLHNPEWIAATPDGRCELDRHAPRVLKALKVLTQLANQWNYNNSDSMTDYYDVNYYTTVSVDWELERDDRIAEEAALKAERSAA